MSRRWTRVDSSKYVRSLSQSVYKFEKSKTAPNNHISRSHNQQPTRLLSSRFVWSHRGTSKYCLLESGCKQSTDPDRLAMCRLHEGPLARFQKSHFDGRRVIPSTPKPVNNTREQASCSDGAPGYSEQHVMSATTSTLRSRYKIRKKLVRAQGAMAYSFSSKNSRYNFKRQNQSKSEVSSLCGSPSHGRQFSPHRLIVKKAIATLRFQRTPLCSYYVKTGRCRSEKSCRFAHDANYLRLCPRFLQQTCTLGEIMCPLAHVLDPCRLPQCEFFSGGNCHRDSCPFLHVNYPKDAPICPNFARGRCELGRKCNKRHVWQLRKRRESSSKRKIVNFSDDEEAKSAFMSSPESPPSGSLRDVFPAPAFIPFVLDDSE
uniref:Zinc finger CCCH domain-containing protein 3 n=1 Tax=Mesocestoides corti TaxID=53468 RepID=A0A5K3FN67_MESCO